MSPAEVLTPRTLAGLRVERVQQRSQFLNVLIYGESGTGKTTLAGSADAVPQMRPVLVVDIEGGTESLRNTYPEVDTVRVTNWKEMQAVYDTLHSGRHDYNTVILDSLTEIQKFNMYQIMEDLLRDNPDRDPDVPSMREWGKNIEQIRRFVRAFRDLQMHSIFTALDRVEKDPRTGVMNHLPMLSGKLASEVAAFLDIVVYYYTKQVGQGDEAETLRLLLTRKTETIVAKDRSGNLPMIVQQPTMAELFRLMNPSATQAEAAAVNA
jgi:ABC-type dipeptide/oligopeptide/nickel transport system ATPase component